MNNKAFFLLLKAGITGTVSQDITDIDWNAVEKTAAEHNVLPLVFDGFQRYYEQTGLSAPLEVKLRLFAACQQAERHYAKHLKAIKTLDGYYKDNGLRMMVLKGYGLSLCYPVPEHRPCGDIDFYQFGDFKRGDELLQTNIGIKIDRTHHHHTCFSWNGISVENHYDFVNVYTHPVNKQLELQLKLLAENEPAEEHDGILLPSPNLAALFVFVHSAAHFAAESVELRQVVDWYLLKKHYGNRIDWKRIGGICDELGFGEFLNVWNEVADVLFDSEDITDMSLEAKKVLAEIMQPAFGRHSSNHHGIRRWVFKLERWWGSRWKMRMVYRKESLLQQFFFHAYSHLIRPENRI